MDNTAVASVRVLAPAGMLGAGFPDLTIERGLELGADVISVDGGSTDSGPTTWAPRSPRPRVPRSPGTCASC